MCGVYMCVYVYVRSVQDSLVHRIFNVVAHITTKFHGMIQEIYNNFFHLFSYVRRCTAVNLAMRLGSFVNYFNPLHLVINTYILDVMMINKQVSMKRQHLSTTVRNISLS